MSFIGLCRFKPSFGKAYGNLTRKTIVLRAFPDLLKFVLIMTQPVDHAVHVCENVRAADRGVDLRPAKC